MTRSDPSDVAVFSRTARHLAATTYRSPRGAHAAAAFARSHLWIRSSTATAGLSSRDNDTCSATNDSADGDFGPYYPGGTGCGMETVKVRQPEGCASTPSVSSALGPQRS